MEATVNTGIDYTYSQSEFNTVVNNTIDKINKVVKKNNYQVVGKFNTGYLNTNNVSKNQMKKIQKYCFWIDKTPSLRRINTFLGLLTQTFGVERVKIKVSLKEEKIQNARKEWLKVRNESDRLLAIYKKEKGDFYKNTLVK